MDKSLQFIKLFKDDDGGEMSFYGGQKLIFKAIVERSPKRLPVIEPTQYGKSTAAACGIITGSCIMKDPWCIIGATNEKAGIIMGYVIQHVFDNALFYSQLQSNSSLERLRQEKSKDRITFKKGGEIFTLSAQARSPKQIKDALTGFGCKNILVDDSALLPDPVYSMIKRMLGGQKDSMLIELTNPFTRNHFKRTWDKAGESGRIFWDYKMALKEGRYSEEFIEEMKREQFFKVLYGCQFPEEDEIDEEGWMPLLQSEQIESAMTEAPTLTGRKRLGVDQGGGVAKTAYIMRVDNYAWIHKTDKLKDKMQTVKNTAEIMGSEKLNGSDVAMDITGNTGAFDRLKELGKYIIGINFGQSPGIKKPDGTVSKESVEAVKRFANKRAEMYWYLKEWIEGGGKLSKASEWYQLATIKYKINSSGKIQLMSKEQMKILGIDSPDEADGLALTFPFNEAKATLKGYVYEPVGAVETDSEFTMANY